MALIQVLKAMARMAMIKIQAVSHPALVYNGICFLLLPLNIECLSINLCGFIVF